MLRWVLSFCGLVSLTACTYEERKCEFESQAISPVIIQDYKTNYRLGDTIIFIQDFNPTRQNGRVIIFPEGADLSWQFSLQNNGSNSLPDSLYSLTAELGSAVALNPNNGRLKVTPIRVGNQFRLALKLRIMKLGTYTVRLHKPGVYEDELIPAGRYQNCVEMIAMEPRFYTSTEASPYDNWFNFTITP